MILEDGHYLWPKKAKHFSYKNVATVPTTPVLTKHSKERRFLYFNHLSKEFLEQMIPHLKSLI